MDGFCRRRESNFPRSGVRQTERCTSHRRPLLYARRLCLATSVGQYDNFPSGLVSPHAVRAYYYTSVTGDAAKLQEVNESLRKLAFEPKVFKKSANRKSKGVDISLTKDLLSQAFLNNYDFVVLIAGDADYLPLVEEVKRLDKILYLTFLSNRLSDDLRLAADWFGSLDKLFLERWRPSAE